MRADRSHLNIVPSMDFRRLRLIGEADLAETGRLEQTIETARAQSGGSVTLELSELTFLDSTTIGVLIRSASRFGDDAPLILRSARGEVRRVLDLVGIDSQVPGLRIIPD